MTPNLVSGWVKSEEGSMHLPTISRTDHLIWSPVVVYPAYLQSPFKNLAGRLFVEESRAVYGALANVSPGVHSKLGSRECPSQRVQGRPRTEVEGS
jgi:hypothetical protein